MAEVWFYHLERQPLEAVLPRILAGLVQRGEKVCVQMDSSEHLEALSRTVWAHEDTAFVAHGVDGEEATLLHKLWMTTDDRNPVGARVRIFTDGVMPDELSGLSRAMVFLVADDETALGKARDLWKRFRAEGVAVRYWKQSDAGRWEDQAAAKAA